MKNKRWKKIGIIISFLAVAAFALSGCSGSDGTPGTSTGVVSGVVTSDGTHALTGVVVSNNLTSTTATTDGTGNYSLTLPIGVYTLTFTKANYTAGTATVSVIAGATGTTNVTLAATAAGKPSVTVTAAANEIGFDQTTTVTATATAPSGGTISYSWSGTDAASTSNTATVRTLTFAKAMGGTAAPASDPGGYIAAYVQENRFGVLPIIPDTKGGKTATVTVNDGMGQSTSASVTVYAAGISAGLKNVPLGVPVYLNSGHATSNTWTVTSAPTGSTVATATLKNASTRNVSFTPDKAGKYTVAEGANTMDIYAGTWVGAISGGTEDANGLPSVTPNPNLCTLCHNGVLTMNGITVPAVFPDWAKTPHATFYATGLNGLTSNNSGCTSCHTTGDDNSPLAVNGGYDDLVTQTGWKYPSTRQKGNWAAMWADAKGKVVAPMTNIQCENCHGPNSDNTAHKSTRNATTFTWGLRTTLSAEMCATCHASGTGHHNYSEWKQLDPDTGYGHSNLATAISESGSASCARCHTGQGYLTYLSQLKAGNIGSLAGTLSNIVTAANAQPITCSTCHDPHDANIGGQLSTASGVPTSTHLRVFGETDLLPSGFSVSGMGTGAICFTCHNSRNAARTGSTTLTYLHEDGETYNPGTGIGNPTGYSAPHQAAQGDVVAGRNAYFMGSSLPMVSKHASVEDACVGCHMKLNPQTHLSHGAAATSTHAFYILDKDKGTLCANCHGATNGEALAASIEDLLTQVSAKMASSVKTKLNAATALALLYFKSVYPLDANGVTVKNSAGAEITTNFTYDGTNKYTSVSVGEVHGQIGFIYKLTTPVTVTVAGVNYTFSSFEVGMGSIYRDAPMTVVAYTLSGNLVRAGWNYFLIEGDQSKGIHNPSFDTAVLNNTLSKDLSN